MDDGGVQVCLVEFVVVGHLKNVENKNEKHIPQIYIKSFVCFKFINRCIFKVSLHIINVYFFKNKHN